MNRSFYAQMLKEGTMKKETTIIAILAILSFLLVTILPCQADDIYGCYPKKGGTLRIVSNLSKCKTKTEYPVTLSGTSQQNQNPIPNFGGDLCWSFLKTEDQDGQISNEEPFTFKLTIQYLSQKYYSVHGILEMTNDNPLILDGIAVISGDNIYISLSETQDSIQDQKLFASHWRMQINQSTLNGNLWSIRTRFKPLTREFDLRYFAGNATFTTCP
jgi:hypothetical protein